MKLDGRVAAAMFPPQLMPQVLGALLDEDRVELHIFSEGPTDDELELIGQDDFRILRKSVRARNWRWTGVMRQKVIVNVPLEQSLEE